MDERTLLVILAFVIILVFSFLARFRSSAGIEVSLFKWLQLHLWGSNAPTGESPQSAGTNSGITMVGGDLVGRDKVTIVQPPVGSDPARPSPALRFLLVDRQGTYSKEVTVQLRSSGFPHDAIFRFVLVNDQTASAAKGVVARLEVFWRGSAPHHAVKVAPFSTPEGWAIGASHLTQDKPIVLTLSSPDILAIPGHPHEWSKVRLTIPERLDGHFLLKYSLSTFEPPLPFEGELRVHLHYV